ncbi:hypothetical protein DL93DRAFT_809416 [Clavulina sp. PMI_390]|nr:hypothetical protein DL93DRAFT_809416 [Clavulina sp. PMI_390]
MPDHVQAYYNAQVMGHSGGFGPGPSAYDPRGVPTYDRGPGGSYGPPGGPSPGGRSYWDGPLAYPPQPGYGSGMYAQPGQQSPYGDQMLSGPLPAGSSLQNTPTASPSNASSSPYYQVGLPSSAGPTRSGLGSPTSRVRYDPYNTAKNHPAASTGRPHSGGEPSWNAYTRLPPVDYTRVLAGGSMPRPGQTTGAGGARSAPVLDPALVGSSAPPPGNSQATAPPEHDDGPHGDGDDQHDASHDHREASPSAKEQEHGDDTGDDEEPNAQSAHSSMYSSRHGDNDDKGSHSLGLPISSARDDASS